MTASDSPAFFMAITDSLVSTSCAVAVTANRTMHTPTSARTSCPGMIDPPCALTSDDAVLLRAKLRNAHLEDVAGLEIARRFHAMRDTGRRPRRDQVPRAQRHELTDVGHQR